MMPLTTRRYQPTSGRPDRGARPFAALPHDLAGDPTIPPPAKAVLLALLFWARDKAVCWPSDASIGARIGRCPGTVQRWLRWLEARGIIAREQTDANVTGRVIRLRWRVTPAAPALTPPASAARDEWEKGEKSKTPRIGREATAADTGEETEADVVELRRLAECADLPPAIRRMAASALRHLGTSAPVDAAAVPTGAEKQVDVLADDAQASPRQTNSGGKIGPVCSCVPARATSELQRALPVGPALLVNGYVNRIQNQVGPAESQNLGSLLQDGAQLVSADRARHVAMPPGSTIVNGETSLPGHRARVSAAQPAGHEPGGRMPWVEALALQINPPAEHGMRTM